MHFLIRFSNKVNLLYNKKTKRLKFARWSSQKPESDDQFLQKIYITDECHAYLCEKVNKQNFCYWGTADPNNDLNEKQQDPH